MHRQWMALGLAAAGAALAGQALTGGADNAGLRLALELSSENQHEAAALEYRRLALAETNTVAQAGFCWMAAYEYAQAQQFKLVPALLERVEDGAASLKNESLLLRAETSSADKRQDEAAFFLQSIVDGDADGDFKLLASRRLAVAEIRSGRVAAARTALQQTPAGDNRPLAALDAFARGHDKSPVLGGVLGMVPGLGYVYAGEYANALRCFLLNGLFVFGMVGTADKDEWGAFAVISFFELTWYSGSIYGGIDSAQRYNRNRQEQCVEGVINKAGYTPDFGRLPLVTLKFQF